MLTKLLPWLLILATPLACRSTRPTRAGGDDRLRPDSGPIALGSSEDSRVTSSLRCGILKTAEKGWLLKDFNSDGSWDLDASDQQKSEWDRLKDKRVCITFTYPIGETPSKRITPYSFAATVQNKRYDFGVYAKAGKDLDSCADEIGKLKIEIKGIVEHLQRLDVAGTDSDIARLQGLDCVGDIAMISK